MNQPAGFELDAAGKVVEVDALQVIFNQAFPYEAVHMLIAAYLVGGFLIASVYAVAMLRGRRDRYHRLGFLIAFSVAAIAAPVQIVVGDIGGPSGAARPAREVRGHRAVTRRPGATSPRSSAATSTPRVGCTAGIKIPDVASLLSGFSADTKIRGLESFPRNARPTNRQANVVHLAWDVMVGIGTALGRVGGVVRVLLVAQAGAAAFTRGSLRAAALAGVASVVAMEAGWVVTEVGRQPWIVRSHLPRHRCGHHRPGRLGHVRRDRRRVCRRRGRDRVGAADDGAPVARGRGHGRPVRAAAGV